MTGTSFAIPVTSQERNVAAKFQRDQPSGLAGDVEIADERTVRDNNYLIWNLIPDKLIINITKSIGYQPVRLGTLIKPICQAW